MDIKILIRKIVSPRKSDLPIYNGDFPMIPVVHKKIHNRHNGIKDTALNAAVFQFLHKARIHKTDRAHIIIEETHFYALLRLCQKDFLHLSEAFPVFYGVILHENKLFGSPKRFYLRFKAQAGFLIEDYLRISVNRKARILLQHGKLISRHPVLSP